MQRFKNKSDVVIGSKIIFNNMTSYIKELARIKMVGTVIEIEPEGDMVVVALEIAGHVNKISVRLPYYLLQ
jgi:hypothetical protein